VLKLQDVVAALEAAGRGNLELKTLQNYARQLSQLLNVRFAFPAEVEVVTEGHLVRWVDCPTTPASS